MWDIDGWWDSEDFVLEAVMKSNQSRLMTELLIKCYDTAVSIKDPL